jgi:hypothetical protein
MVRARCRLQDKIQDADYVVEVRVGALGADSHEVNYGVPGTQALNQTASLVTSSPVPSVPEISLARRDERRAAAKIAVFAYHRETKEPIWETGTVQGTSLAKSTWFLGAGPFQKGSIYETVEISASPIEAPTNLAQPVIAWLRRPFRKRTNSVLPTGNQTRLAEAKEQIHLLPVPQHPLDQLPNTSEVPGSPTMIVTGQKTQASSSGAVQASANIPIDDVSESLRLLDSLGDSNR